MRTRPISKVSKHVPSKQAFTIDTDAQDLKLHTLAVLTARRGGGKTVGIANLIATYRQKGYYDRVLLVTPTYHSNVSIWKDIAHIDEADLFEPESGVVSRIVAFVENERLEWDTYLEKKKKWREMQARLKRGEDMDDDWLLLMDDAGVLDGKEPKWKYKHERPPQVACILDDVLGLPVMANRKEGLTNLCIRHRHLGRGLGISLFMLIQSYCAHGGLARVVRENVVVLCIFRTSDEKQMKKIWEEADFDNLSYEKFRSLADYCFQTPYNFLLCDFNPKSPTLRFRSGWNDALEID